MSSPKRDGHLEKLRQRALNFSRVVRATFVFRRWTLRDKIATTGYVRIVEDGELVIGKTCFFYGGMIPTELVVHRGGRLELEEQTAVNWGVSIECSRSIVIGTHTMISKMVRIRDNDGQHTAPVRIGARVWIAHGAMIEPGVTIGDDAVISAGSVVTRDVPARYMAIGNPARPVPMTLRGGAPASA